jgi:predicted transglutaminase-like cysteine proteinase
MAATTARGEPAFPGAQAQRSASFTPLGSPAIPPRGYVAFCKRQPRDCGDSRSAVLGGARQADSEFAELMRSADTPPTSTLIDGTAPAAGSEQAQRLTMTPALWAKLSVTNAAINAAVTAQSDSVVYGQDDYWATPLRTARHLGDCEDIALEKQRALIASGVPRSALNLAEVVTPDGQVHVVLLVDTRTADLVLDSLTPWIMPWATTPYRWVKRQVGGAPFHWSMIRGAASGAQLAMAAAHADPAALGTSRTSGP